MRDDLAERRPAASATALARSFLLSAVARSLTARRARTIAVTVAAAVLAGCAWAPPKPWEKGELARPAMQFDPPAERLEARFQEQVYSSKEAASGGFGVGGGGCGCN